MSDAFGPSEVDRILGNLLNPSDPRRSELSPNQSGGYRLPAPSGFKVLATNTFSWGGTHYVLSWTDVEDSYIKGYRVYYADGTLPAGQMPSLAGGATRSPAHINVSIPTTGTVIFWLQPYLASGLELPLDACPTCSTQAPAASYSLELDDLSTGNATLMRIDNDLPSGGGGTTTGFGVYDQVDGRHTNMSAAFFEVLNANGRLVATFAAQTTAASTPGVVRVANGTGTGSLGAGQTVILDGSNGRISFYGGSGACRLSGDVGGALGAFVGSLVLRVAGVDYKLPYYA